MTTKADDLLDEVTARLQAGSPEVWYPLPTNVRRDHRVNVTLAKAPAIHVVDGDEEIVARRKNNCDVDIRLHFTVAVFVRDDQGFAAAAPIKTEVMARLNVDGVSPVYSHNAILEPGDIRKDQEIADNDSLRVEMKFWFLYSRDKWTL